MIDSCSMTEPRLPLQGIRVLELAQVVAGPFCGTLMAEFGAEVIKTEMPGRGDDLRRLGPSEDGCSYWFAVDNRNKKLMTLDLHVAKGQDIVRKLVAKCDVVLENFRPGVLERGGLPHAGWPGGAFETQDGKWIVFTAPAQHLFERLCAMIGQPDLPRDPRFAGAAERPKNIDAILELMTQWFSGRRFDKAVAELKASDIPHSPIMSMADIFVDPHYRARQMLIDVPAEGLGSLPQPGVVPKLSLTPGRVTHAGAALGRHTDEILSGVLGLTADEIVSLRAERVV